MTTTPAEIPVPFASKKHDNDEHENECLLCGRGLSDAAVARACWVHMTTDCMLVPAEAPTPANSQGCFPVGPHCKRRVPRAYRLPPQG